MEPMKQGIGRGLLWGAALVLGLSGCYTTNPALTSVDAGGACPAPTSQFDIARQQINGACANPAGGAAAGASCNSASDCAANCCTNMSVQLCVDHVCQAATAACACANSPMTASNAGTCGGESASPGAQPHGGAANGAACTNSSECGEVNCTCATGAPSYFAAACLNGKCDSTQACACVAQQFQNKFGHDVCGASTSQPGQPTAGNSCNGESGGPGTSPTKGIPAGGACSDSSQCAQVTCPCGSNNAYYAGACTNGVCDISSACACVAAAYQRQYGKDVCTATGPISMPPPPQPVTSCDGSASNAGGARVAGNSGASCKSSSDCTQATCACANGKPSYYAASCVNGVCDNTNACACVQTQYKTTYGKDVCS